MNAAAAAVSEATPRQLLLTTFTAAPAIRKSAAQLKILIFQQCLFCWKPQGRDVTTFFRQPFKLLYQFI
jgi:hypothetical protein